VIDLTKLFNIFIRETASFRNWHHFVEDPAPTKILLPLFNVTRQTQDLLPDNRIPELPIPDPQGPDQRVDRVDVVARDRDRFRLVSPQHFAFRFVSVRVETLRVVAHRHPAKRARNRSRFSDFFVARKAYRFRIVEDSEREGPVRQHGFERFYVPSRTEESADIFSSEFHVKGLTLILMFVMNEMIGRTKTDQIAIRAFLTRFSSAIKARTHFKFKLKQKLKLFKFK
jgi:hypothetical protein